MSRSGEWYEVRFDDTGITLMVGAPGEVAWRAAIAWKSITRVCFEVGDLSEPDTVYLFTDTRPESYAIPAEARGGQALWAEILDRKLFDAEMAMATATSSKALFCFPPLGEHVGPEPAVLTTPGQLPDLEDERLVLTWDQIEADSIILHGDMVVWRERTGWEVYERFEEIANILIGKYGRRLVDIVPTQRSLYALYGDSTRAYFHVTYVREALAKGSGSSDAQPDA